MTNVQKQCLLCYLGFYTGEIDGLWGPQSKQATVCFQQAYGLDLDGVFGQLTEEKILEAVAGTAVPTEPEKSKEPENFWGGIKHFSREEFRCKCGGKYCNGFPAEPARKLVELAERVREHFAAPATVSSGVRCQIYNDSLPNSSKTSRHRIGTAMDFCVKGKSAAEVLEYVWKQPETHYAYAIDGSFVHMDVIV